MYLKSNNELKKEIIILIKKEMQSCFKSNITDKNYINYQVESLLKSLIYDKTKKKPFIEILFS